MVFGILVIYIANTQKNKIREYLKFLLRYDVLRDFDVQRT